MGTTVRAPSFGVPLQWSGGLLVLAAVSATLAALGLTHGPTSLAVSVLALIGAAGLRSVATHSRRPREREREREKNGAAAFTLANDGHWELDPASSKINYSERCSSMLGYEHDEVHSHLAAWGQLVHPEDLAPARAALDAYLHGESDTYQVIVRLRTKDGTWRSVLDRGWIVERDAQGSPTRLVGLHLDLTASLPVTAENTLGATSDSATRLRLSHTLSLALDHEVVSLLGHAELDSGDFAVSGPLSAIERSGVRASALTLAIADMTASEPTQQGIDLLALTRDVVRTVERYARCRVAFVVRGPHGLPCVGIPRALLRAALLRLLDQLAIGLAEVGGTLDLSLGCASERVYLRLAIESDDTGCASRLLAAAERELAVLDNIDIITLKPGARILQMEFTTHRVAGPATAPPHHANAGNGVRSAGAYSHTKPAASQNIR